MRACIRPATTVLPAFVAALVGALVGALLVACSFGTSGSGTGAGPANPATSPTGSPSATAPSATPDRSTSTAPSSAAPTRAPVRTVTVVDDSGDSYVVRIWTQRHVADCPAHAYGRVRSFLRSHPCTGVRQLLATTRIGDRPVALAIRTVGFRGRHGDPYGYRAAGAFEKLVSRSGTGNVNDLLREGYRLPDGTSAVTFPNAFSALGQDNGVTVTEAWYLDGPTRDNDPALVKAEQALFLRV